MMTSKATPFSSFPAVSTRLEVSIGEHRWYAASWSVAGITIFGNLTGILDGAVYPASLRFGDETALVIHTTVRTQIGNDVSRLIFTDISHSHAELLHQLVDDTRHQADNDLLRLLDSANDNNVDQGKVARSVVRRLRIAVMLLFTALLLAGATWLLYVTLITVRSTEAAVSANGREIYVPVAGRLVDALPLPGTTVEKGQVIGTIDSEEIFRRLSVLDAEETRLQGAILLARTRLGELQTLAAAEETKLLAEKAAIQAKLDLTSRRLAIESGHLDRLQKLGEVTSLRGAEEQHAQVLSVTEQVRGLERDMADVDARLANLAVNSSGIELAANTLTTSSLNAEIETNNASLAVLRKEREALRDRTVLRAPCDCVVNAVMVEPGDALTTTSPLAVLVDPASTVVEAMIPAASASSLRTGDPVGVELADGRRFTGEIAGISYRPRAENSSWLRGKAGEGVHAWLDVRVDGLGPADVGLIAQVRAKPRRVAGFLGWDMIQDLLQ